VTAASSPALSSQARSEREWALHFPAEREPEALAHLLRRDREGTLVEADFADAAARAVLRRTLPRILRSKRGPFQRIYYGAEFCEHLIPRPDRLRRVLAAAREETPLPVSLLTHYVTDRGLEKLRPLLAAAEECGEGTEVVVNDWGVLRMARREFPGLRLVLGRLMNKMMRDPRVAPFYADGPAEGLKALSQSSATLPIYRRFLVEMGVGRIELDALYQGIDLELGATGLQGTLYLPFGYVASGRICLSGSLHLPKEDKFRFDLGCRHECQDYTVELKNSRSPYQESRELALYQRGNTVFYPQEGKYLDQALQSLDRIGIDRVVVELDTPM
jgi:hypothetical protein